MKPEFFKDKVIIVTGASSGIGLASARLFGSCGAKVVMAARSYEKLQELAPSVSPDPAKVLCVKTDVTSEDDCRALIDAAVERFGGIDIADDAVELSLRAGERPLPPDAPFGLQGKSDFADAWSDMSVSSRISGLWSLPVSSNRFFRAVFHW